jgi:hypothetical protein
MNKQITFAGVTGYATYAFAVRRGNEVAAGLDKLVANLPKHYYTWFVIAKPDGRFLPVFACNNLPGGPGPLLGERNVGIIN